MGLDDDFFDLGGHSLLATRLVALLRDRTGVAPALRTVFEQATVAALAETLELGAGNANPLGPVERPAVIPLSFAQRRLWFLNRFDPGSGAYNIPVVLELKGTLDVPALRGAINQVADRHESLRTVFPLVDGEPAQRILSGRPVELLAVQCTAEALAGALAAETRRGFDVTRELPLRAVLFQLAPDHHVLAITLHHIAADGWSLAPLAQDLSLAYNALAAGTDTPLAPLPVQYADYTLWQRDELGSEDDPASAISRQLEFWTRELRGAPEELRLPFDFSRGAQGAAEPASSVPLTISPETGARLNALAREHNASLFMVLQAALAALLTKSGAGEDIPLGTPVAGRTDTQLNELVGFFVNTLVLRTNTSGNPTAAELVESVRYTNLHAYANQDAPFERVVEELNPARSQHRHPLFQVMLTLQNTAAAGLSMDGLEATADLSQEPGGAKFDLLLDLVEEAVTTALLRCHRCCRRHPRLAGLQPRPVHPGHRRAARGRLPGRGGSVRRGSRDHPGPAPDPVPGAAPARPGAEPSRRGTPRRTGTGRKPSSTPSRPQWPGPPTRRRSSTPPARTPAPASAGSMAGSRPSPRGWWPPAWSRATGSPWPCRARPTSSLPHWRCWPRARSTSRWTSPTRRSGSGSSSRTALPPS